MSINENKKNEISVDTVLLGNILDEYKTHIKSRGSEELKKKFNARRQYPSKLKAVAIELKCNEEYIELLEKKEANEEAKDELKTKVLNQARSLNIIEEAGNILGENVTEGSYAEDIIFWHIVDYIYENQYGQRIKGFNYEYILEINPHHVLPPPYDLLLCKITETGKDEIETKPKIDEDGIKPEPKDEIETKPKIGEDGIKPEPDDYVKGILHPQKGMTTPFYLGKDYVMIGFDQKEPNFSKPIVAAELTLITILQILHVLHFGCAGNFERIRLSNVIDNMAKPGKTEDIDKKLISESLFFSNLPPRIEMDSKWRKRSIYTLFCDYKKTEYTETYMVTALTSLWISKSYSPLNILERFLKLWTGVNALYQFVIQDYNDNTNDEYKIEEKVGNSEQVGIGVMGALFFKFPYYMRINDVFTQSRIIGTKDDNNIKEPHFKIGGERGIGYEGYISEITNVFMNDVIGLISKRMYRDINEELEKIRAWFSKQGGNMPSGESLPIIKKIEYQQQEYDPSEEKYIEYLDEIKKPLDNTLDKLNIIGREEIAKAIENRWNNLTEQYYEKKDNIEKENDPKKKEKLKKELDKIEKKIKPLMEKEETIKEKVPYEKGTQEYTKAFDNMCNDIENTIEGIIEGINKGIEQLKEISCASNNWKEFLKCILIPSYWRNEFMHGNRTLPMVMSAGIWEYRLLNGLCEDMAVFLDDTITSLFDNQVNPGHLSNEQISTIRNYVKKCKEEDQVR